MMFQYYLSKFVYSYHNFGYFNLVYSWNMGWSNPLIKLHGRLQLLQSGTPEMSWVILVVTFQMSHDSDA